MKGKNLKKYSREELNARMKTLRGILVILGILVLLYLMYFVTKLLSGTWQANHTLGIVGLGSLVVTSSAISIQLVKILNELKSRK